MRGWLPTSLFVVMALGAAARAQSPAGQAPPGRAEGPAAAQPKTAVSFDDQETGKPPKGFSFGRTGSGGEGSWIVRDASDGKGKVLAQTDADETSYRFPVAVLDSASAKDGTFRVRFRPVSGKVDQAGGIVFRYAGPNDYYVVRANALEDNCRIYRVVGGKRNQLGGKDVKVASGQWHTLEVIVQGNRFQVQLDGERVCETTDDTFASAGKVGVWTKADSVTEFDDFTIEPLSPKESSSG